MSTTVTTHGNDIPDYRGGLLTATEYSLVEGAALSGRATVKNALVRNGYRDGLCFWQEYRPAPMTTMPVPDPMQPNDLGRSLLTLALTAVVVWVAVGVVTAVVTRL